MAKWRAEFWKIVTLVFGLTMLADASSARSAILNNRSGGRDVITSEPARPQSALPNMTSGFSATTFPNRPLGQAPSLDAEIFDLPWLRGYGNVKSLHVAYQEDPSLRHAAADLKDSGWLNALRSFDGFMAQWTGLTQAHAAHAVTRDGFSTEDKVWCWKTLAG